MAFELQIRFAFGRSSSLSNRPHRKLCPGSSGAVTFPRFPHLAGRMLADLPFRLGIREPA